MYPLRIRDLREDNDLNQTEVAELLNVHQTHIQIMSWVG